MRNELSMRTGLVMKAKLSLLLSVLSLALLSCATVPRTVATECPKPPDYPMLKLPVPGYFHEKIHRALNPISTPAQSSTTPQTRPTP